ncbi:MAG TPA: aspartate aminotransferase family protein, partial [Actinomycetota bacterium]|nr:aspartate aminotransferase family protein [Actinomycetota bacterium]
MSDLRDLLMRTAERVAAYRATVGERPVDPQVDVERFRATFGGSFPDAGAEAERVIDELVAAAEPALMATVGPRYFGFVMGGALDAATCADLLTTG